MTLIRATNLRFGYDAKPPWVIDGVSLAIEAGTTVGIVGESGSGKSTVIRLLSGMLTPQEGAVFIDGTDAALIASRSQRELRSFGQMVFQSPRNSFDPRMRLARSLAEPTRALKRQVPPRQTLEGWMSRVGLPAELLDRFPHQLSGGQLQRVSLARAISVAPRVLYADEPTSALDVSVQAQILDLLIQLRTELHLTLVMVTHDLAVAARLCDRIIVFRKGMIVEDAASADILMSPKHEYTAGLIAAARAVSLRS